MASKYPLTVQGFYDFVKNELEGKPETVPGENPEDCGQHTPVMDGEVGYIGENSVISYAHVLGCDNPLYTDPVYARKTRYGGLIAIPTITNILRYLPPHPKHYGDWPVSSLVGGLGWIWNDVIRPNQKFHSSFYLSEVLDKKGATGRLLITKSDAKYWNQDNDLIAIGWGSQIMIGKDLSEEEIKSGKGFRDSMLYERPTYHYSQEEIKKIEEGIASEKMRGAKPLYWEDVKVGDKLTPVVKGPLSMFDLMNFYSMLIGASPSCFEIPYRRLRAAERTPTENSATGWPYEHMGMEHYDFYLCKSRGLPGPFDEGQQRCCTTAHLLSNWMGDEGFIRKVDTQLRKPNYYGDTQWVSGEVVNKYKEKVGDEEYNAVDVIISQVNQVGENTAPGKATVYLPSKGKPVTLPIPHESRHEDYVKYMEDCKKRREEMKTQGLL